MGPSPATGLLRCRRLLDRYGSDRLVDLARAKDSGFTTDTFLDALRAMHRLGPADWAEDGISEQDVTRLHTLFDGWLNRLDRSE